MVNHPNRRRTRQEAANTPKVERSFSGIRNALFEDWDLMRQGKIDIELAKASSRMAHEILASVPIQLEAMRFEHEFGNTPKLLTSDDK